jgi:hypothetical protein
VKIKQTEKNARVSGLATMLQLLAVRSASVQQIQLPIQILSIDRFKGRDNIFKTKHFEEFNSKENGENYVIRYLAVTATKLAN